MNERAHKARNIAQVVPARVERTLALQDHNLFLVFQLMQEIVGRNHKSVTQEDARDPVQIIFEVFRRDVPELGSKVLCAEPPRRLGLAPRRTGSTRYQVAVKRLPPKSR